MTAHRRRRQCTTGSTPAGRRARLRAFVGDLVADGVRSGPLLGDVPAEELAEYALAARSAAGRRHSERLIIVILTGFRPTR
jgi:hypothetical protein